MVNEFKFWIKSILEQTPPPEEINSLLFVLNYSKNYGFIELNFYQDKPNQTSNFVPQTF